MKRTIAGGPILTFCNGMPFAEQDEDGTVGSFVTDGSKPTIETRATEPEPLPVKDYEGMSDEQLANCLASDSVHPPASYWVDYEEDHRAMLKAAARRIKALSKD